MAAYSSFSSYLSGMVNTVFESQRFAALRPLCSPFSYSPMSPHWPRVGGSLPIHAGPDRNSTKKSLPLSPGPGPYLIVPSDDVSKSPGPESFFHFPGPTGLGWEGW